MVNVRLAKNVENIIWKKSAQLKGVRKNHALKDIPKLCKFFPIQKSCKFGEQCSYKHVTTSHKNDNSEIINKLVFLEGSIEMIKEKIAALTEEIDNI